MQQRIKLFLSVLLFLPLSLWGQQTVFEEGQTVYEKESAGGIILHTNGWGVNYYMGKYLTAFKKRLYHFELVSMNTPKEIRVSANDNGRSYKYGKLNNLTILRTSFGVQNEFINKQSVKGVAVNYNYNIGISHGFAKPVYLIISHLSGNSVVYTDERYDPEIHQQEDIVGRSSFYKGMDEIKYHPGLFLKFAMGFEYSRMSKLVRYMETGIAADLFVEPIELLAYNDPHQAFLTAYVTISFGKKKFAGENKDNSTLGE